MGFNAYPIRTSDAPLFADGRHVQEDRRQLGHRRHQEPLLDQRGVERLPVGEMASAPIRSKATRRSTRGIIRYATLDEFKQDPDFAHEKGDCPEDPERDDSLFPN